MTIIYFLLILAALILVHELGHFLVAKATGMRVDEFGLGFPPRVAKLFQKGETEYTLNLLPIGGFVKIFGENYDDPGTKAEFGTGQGVNEDPSADSSRSFVKKPLHKQALVLVAGVTFNMVFAWLLISLGYMVGLPTPVNYDGPGEVRDPRVVVTSIVEGSPAAATDLKVGDSIAGIKVGETALTDVTTENISEFIASHQDDEIVFDINRGDEQFQIVAEPAVLSAHESENGGVGTVEREVVGIQMNAIGTLRLLPHQALWEGFRTTGDVTVAIAVGITEFLYEAVTGAADYSNVAGPVGIVGLVGDASTLGFIYLLQFTAFISINLAIINLLPIPALDGGRLLFVAIEAIKGSPINPKVAGALNTIGFVLLMLLMIAVTYNDVLRIL